MLNISLWTSKASSLPLELLHTNQVVIPIDGQGIDKLIRTGHLANRLCTLVLLIFSLLHRDDLPVLECNDRSDITAVGSCFIKLLVQIELKLHTLQSVLIVQVPSVLLISIDGVEVEPIVA